MCLSLAEVVSSTNDEMDAMRASASHRIGGLSHRIGVSDAGPRIASSASEKPMRRIGIAESLRVPTPSPSNDETELKRRRHPILTNSTATRTQIQFVNSIHLAWNRSIGIESDELPSTVVHCHQDSTVIKQTKRLVSLTLRNPTPSLVVCTDQAKSGWITRFTAIASHRYRFTAIASPTLLHRYQAKPPPASTTPPPTVLHLHNLSPHHHHQPPPPQLCFRFTTSHNYTITSLHLLPPPNSASDSHPLPTNPSQLSLHHSQAQLHHTNITQSSLNHHTTSPHTHHTPSSHHHHTSTYSF
ncbi:hypothetical protein PGT21_018995 [Puccinia graminis f. sp. tritici]|uniref:Uncharacterized protein n=1 Tax=Puccinia graminis f. sp. tritici TaxID=56615 RepID=A0A5B0N2Q2_PUCGR|nr:hypothetical protein PGT21_018995 [Puccinia graminis f. sp. tritici]